MSFYGIENEDDSPFGEEQVVTHYPGCWKEHGICATKKLNELLTLLSMSKKKIDRDELKNILEG